VRHRRGSAGESGVTQLDHLRPDALARNFRAAWVRSVGARRGSFGWRTAGSFGSRPTRVRSCNSVGSRVRRTAALWFVWPARCSGSSDCRARVRSCNSVGSRVRLAGAGFGFVWNAHTSGSFVNAATSWVRSDTAARPGSFVHAPESQVRPHVRPARVLRASHAARVRLALPMRTTAVAPCTKRASARTRAPLGCPLHHLKVGRIALNGGRMAVASLHDHRNSRQPILPNARRPASHQIATGPT
jgi:hypothetical protein